MKATEILQIFDNLKDEDALVRENAAYVLGEKAIEFLEISRSTLKSLEQLERQHGLANMNLRNNAINALIACLTDEEAWVRGNAADALGKFNAEEAVSHLEILLNDVDHIVRQAASDSLGRIGSIASIDRLGEATRDEEWSVRVSAVRALGHFSEAAVLPYLEDAKGDPNLDVRIASMSAIAAIKET